MLEGSKAITFTKHQDPREEYLATLSQRQREQILALPEKEQARLYAVWQDLTPTEREDLQRLAQDNTAGHNRMASCQSPKP